MTFTRGQEVHPGTVWLWREPTSMWTQETCSFCGSVRANLVAEWLENGNDASGSDWKRGWPHKFYATDNDEKRWKFYSEHLTELGPDTFAQVSKAILDALRIEFAYDTVGRMFVRAPSFGYQTWRYKGVYRESLPTAETGAWEFILDREILGE